MIWSAFFVRTLERKQFKGNAPKTIQGQCPKSLLFVGIFFFKVYRKCLGSGKKNNNEVANLTEIDSCYER